MYIYICIFHPHLRDNQPSASSGYTCIYMHIYTEIYIIRYTCIYMYISTCILIHICRTLASLPAPPPVHTYIYIYINIYTCTHMQNTYVTPSFLSSTLVCIRIYKYVYIYTYVEHLRHSQFPLLYACMCTFIYICILIHICRKLTPLPAPPPLHMYIYIYINMYTYTYMQNTYITPSPPSFTHVCIRTYKCVYKYTYAEHLLSQHPLLYTFMYTYI